ncbi:MAG: sulfite exporter TauE/SafE family protein [Anaerolineales bacterium]|nr:sulfite exporter TauE/SafE family protein [Anaerolineales bacterium]
MTDPLTLLDFVLAALAAMAAGAVNAIAGGGTLISFPVLTAIGIPAIAANITNTVALTPGYLGATMAQKEDLAGQRRRMKMLIPAAALGGIAGALLLVNTQEKVFRELIPYLILLASFLLAIQDPVRKWLARRAKEGKHIQLSEWWTTVPIFVAAIYGGYFGAGLSIIILAVLGLVIDDSLTRLNALKQALAFSVNVAAAFFFLFSGQVVWSIALVMMVGAIAGGAMGGKFAGRIKPATLRWVVVTIGVVVAIIYFVR